MNTLRFSSLFLILLLASTVSCKKKKVIDQSTEDHNIITKYISDNHLNAQQGSDGLYYVITTQGTGAQPNINSKVTVSYKGYLTNGNVFDQSSSSGATFNLSGVIKGWQEGIPLFKKGGVGKLLIPSALGYGDQAQNGIPANSVLIFDINLLNVQ
ncbi:MAG: FKBP-type peptidyl-prolyl cis-trans isomerase [Bacteroidetes bacterium]|nr:FKBP-type peptidyl-prolyl cis-trans isomerase [Bacteroidota bacterium]